LTFFRHRGGLGLLGLLAGCAALSQAAPPRPCLSVSPFRATLTSDTATLQQRVRLLDSLRAQLKDGWLVEPAGRCPQKAPTLDLFQRPGDLVEIPGNAMLRVRMEWRHVAGATIVTLEPQGHLGGDMSQWSRTLAFVAQQQMLVPVQIGSNASQTSISGSLDGIAPISALLPPGPLHLEAKAPDRISQRVDTVVQMGRPFQANFHLTKVPSARPSSTPRWIAYATATACLVGAGIFAWQQERAETRYHSLGKEDSKTSFDSRWNDVRSANLWRNGLAIGGAGALGIGLAFHFREASFSW
jgi:hypothetical protein